MNGTLPSIEECKLSSMSRPPSQRVVDSTKLTIRKSQSESITDCMNIKVEPVTDSSDYTGVEPWSILNKCEDIEERREEKTGYFMSREQKDILTNIKREEDGERQSVKMEGADGVKYEEGLWKKEEKESDEEMGGHVAQTCKQEVEELSTLITSCLQKQPRVLIRRLEIASSSVPVLLPPCTMACKRDLGVRSPWRQHELLSLGGNRSLRQKKGQVMTRKMKTNGQLERPPKMLPSSSENRTGRSQQPPSSAHEHLIPPTPTPSHTGTPGAHTCSHVLDMQFVRHFSATVPLSKDVIDSQSTLLTFGKCSTKFFTHRHKIKKKELFKAGPETLP
ncbi:hypothetical protein SKAU_G00182760 [Synaphobranchus kaupii]|uniref:Uncharacterized protein n=1 Tax=Synaphobranchus kaupii TaxID=118154 RepID=A0A9Q1FC28_SYNKA|nr:hypothetical protein SKAU_G00182760 [Synaphobranchus kaupii]